MDIVEIERTLTMWAAKVLNLTVDKGIYRGAIPTGKMGVAVILGSEIPGTGQFRPRTYNVQILGKFKDRDSASRMLSKLSGALPVHEKIINGMKFKSLSQRGESEPYKTEDNGQIVFNASFNAIAVVLTTGVQV